ncbi:MAG: hypothetical protein CM1200mP41_32800 [Gammaproteobacteria bacterium]|nr:MAG: hypothetical protein CM1200mP41_32800 [Gammaproteobacteria bacterium]
MLWAPRMCGSVLETQRFNTHDTAQNLATHFSADKTYRFMQLWPNGHYPTITSSNQALPLLMHQNTLRITYSRDCGETVRFRIQRQTVLFRCGFLVYALE